MDKCTIFGSVKSVSKKGVTVVASNEMKDRYGEIIKADGWDLENFVKNPVMLFGHDYGSLPVGKWVNARVEGKELVVDGIFAKTIKAKEVEELVNDKILNAVSVGLIVKERDEEDEDVIKKAELLEISWVPIPANPSALMRAVKKGYSFSLNKDVKKVEVDLKGVKEVKEIIGKVKDKEDEIDKDEALLKHYKNIIPMYRNMSKELRELVELEADEDEIKQIGDLKTKLVQTIKELDTLHLNQEENPADGQDENQLATKEDVGTLLNEAIGKYI